MQVERVDGYGVRVAIDIDPQSILEGAKFAGFVAVALGMVFSKGNPWIIGFFQSLPFPLLPINPNPTFLDGAFCGAWMASQSGLIFTATRLYTDRSDTDSPYLFMGSLLILAVTGVARHYFQ